MPLHKEDVLLLAAIAIFIFYHPHTRVNSAAINVRPAKETLDLVNKGWTYRENPRFYSDKF